MERCQAVHLLDMPFLELIRRADEIRRDSVGSRFELCSIINAKSGACSEDCKFCAQSTRNSTDVQAYPLKDKQEIVDAARRAKEIGAERFGIVTSGNRLSQGELCEIAGAISDIKCKVGVDVCASLGALDGKALRLLKSAGLTRYHHNIETSPRFYPSIVSTHTIEERVGTIKAAKAAGLEVCSGGILGMGETWQDRIDMAELLRELDVDSVPLNMLVPIEGTPMASQESISPIDAIRSISIFRIILGGRALKIAAGRETVLKDFQALGFMAGANGMLIGGYLTVKGRDVREDHVLVKEIDRLWRL